MNSLQSVVPPLKNSVISKPQKHTTDPFMRNSGNDAQKNGTTTNNDIIGIVEVYVHQARHIHNICIYQKQDVYAKLCLTNDPENAISTQIINGGGQNPVFNQIIRLNVRKIDSLIKCEIWMLSRVKNYLEDQLLGFALVPLSEVVMRNGKLEKDFSLSSTDLFHSPAGFVQLSLSYSGASPNLMEISAFSKSVPDEEVLDSLASVFNKLEFPDPNIANVNDIMVSEYCAITNMDSQTSGCLESSDTDKNLKSEIGADVVDNSSTDNVSSIAIPEHDIPPSSVSINASPSSSIPASCQSSDSPRISKSSSEECISPPKDNQKEKPGESGDGESDITAGASSNSSAKPAITMNIEPERKVEQQDFVNMYMKSMQEFTDSLAKMKLPMDVGSGTTSSGDSSTDQNSQGSNTPSSRVFYGSRAFF
ncbi:C2 domain-containing protein [Heracleum sosnowskyi]|uniref:C2 domain-containing protein n=1 Tax=Heracleum sosnowskyi TaxID=360622 RepID=A0AAD8J703_9APIA|nr:C2 domain-containing protein [Heracleum sosnowskyi]